MTKRLNGTVHVGDDEHTTTAFAVGTAVSDLPEWAKALIGEHAFDDDAVKPEEAEPQVIVPYGAPHPDAKAEEPASTTTVKTKSAKSADSK